MYEPIPVVPDPVLVALWKLDPDCLFRNGEVERALWGLFALELNNELGWEVGAE
jgi:hypothetical protein